MPDESEINAAADRASDQVNKLNGSTKYRIMSYEQGVRDALDWACGNRDEDPTVDE